MLWLGLDLFGCGLVIAISGVLLKSASILVNNETAAFILTTIGIIVFIAGLYMALAGMDNRFKEFKEVRFGPGKKKCSLKRR